MTTASSPAPASTTTALGVHSEVGKLRKVMVHRPDLELSRLTPDNHDDLLFDDVLWVRRARQQHDQFADLLRDRGTEVLDRAVTSFTVGEGIVDEARAYLEQVDATTLADHLIGGLTVSEAQALLAGKTVAGVSGGEGALAKRSLVA